MIYDRLITGNIDHLLAQHVAHLFIRDTVSLFSEKVHQNDEEDTDHFEVRNRSILILLFKEQRMRKLNKVSIRDESFYHNTIMIQIKLLYSFSILDKCP